jgi:hypothetical protein
MRILTILALCLLVAGPAAALPAPDLNTPGDVPAVIAPAPGAPVAAAAGHALSGTFRVQAGSCTGATRSGSFFRMVQPGGTVAGGPFVENADSPCADRTYTPLSPGTDGGLVSGRHQPQPSAPFDGTGNGTARRIVAPARFFGVNFAVATNPTDPQTGTRTAPPVLRRDGGTLSGDLRAIGVAWNRQHFNQGAPKPDGSTPGATTLPRGTIDASSKAYRLDWASTIVGGPFNNFTGAWHLEGTFDGALGGDAATTVRPPADDRAAAAPESGGAAGTTTPRTGPAPTTLWAVAALGLAAALRRERRA